MAIKTKAELKGYFRKGMYPTESQFADWLDSYRHKGDKVGLSEVEGLAGALNGKYDAGLGRELAANQEKQGEELVRLGLVQRQQGEELTEVETLAEGVMIYPFDMTVYHGIELMGQPIGTVAFSIEMGRFIERGESGIIDYNEYNTQGDDGKIRPKRDRIYRRADRLYVMLHDLETDTYRPEILGFEEVEKNLVQPMAAGLDRRIDDESSARVDQDNVLRDAIEAEAKARGEALAELRATVEAEIASGSAAGHGTASLELRRREVLPFDYYVGSVEEWVDLQKKTQFLLKEGDIVYNICFPGFVQWDGEAFRTSWGERVLEDVESPRGASGHGEDARAEVFAQEQGEETQAGGLSHSTPGADMDPRGASGHGGAAVLGLGGLVSGPDLGEAGLLEMIDFADSDYYGDLWPLAEEATCRQPGRQSLFRLRSDNSLWCWDGAGLVKVSDISALAGLREELDETAETLAGIRGTVDELGIDEFGLAGENNNSLEISMGGERLTAAITADPEYGQRVIEAPWSETVVLIANLSGWGVTTLRTSFQRGFSGMISGGSNHIHEVVKCIARRNAYTPPNEKIGDLRSSAAYVEPMIVRYGNVQYLALRFKQSGKFLLEGWLKDCLKEFVMLKVETTGGMPEGVTEEIQFARQSYLDDFNVSVANRLKPAVLTTEDLNRIPPSKTEEDAGVSYYIADSGNECKNKPWRVYGFWLKVEAMISKGVMVVYQTLTTFGNKPTTYRRECQVSIWSEWEEVPNPETEITSIREAVGLGEKPPQVFIERFTSHLSIFKSLRQLAPEFNSDTNCFEFNELTDISYADARAIDLMMEPHVYDCYSGGSGGIDRFAHLNVRTFTIIVGTTRRLNLMDTFVDSNLETLRIVNIDGLSCENDISWGSGSRTTPRMARLKKILGDLVFYSGSDWQTYSVKFDMPMLEQIRIRCSYIDADRGLDFSLCPKLSLESVRYTIERSTGKPLLTYHPDVYAKLSGDVSNAEASKLSADELQEWIALMDLAVAKGFTIQTTN